MIHIVTDSTCDLPPDIVQRYPLTVIPMTLNIEGRPYRDGVDITRREYYTRLPGLKTLPTTAASGPEDFEQAYRACGDADIVSIHIATSLSGVLNVARLGAEASGQRVTLVDSQQATMGLGWQALAAAEAAAAGASLESVLQIIASIQKRVKVLALLDTLEYLRRGGRASALTAALSDFLQIKLLLQVAEGKITSLAKLRTHRRGLDKLVELVEGMGPLERLALIHVNSPADAQALAQRLDHCRQPGAPPLIITDVTAIIGTHVGPGAVGVAVVPAA